MSIWKGTDLDFEVLYRQRLHDLEAHDYGQPFPGCHPTLDELRAPSIDRPSRSPEEMLHEARRVEAASDAADREAER